MPADISAYVAAAKQVWTSDRLEEQLYQDTPTLSEFEATDRFSIGKEAVTPLHVSRNGGYTALADNETVLNTAGNQGQAQARWNYTNHFVPVKIVHSAFVGTRGNSKAIVNVVDNETEGAVNDLRHELERQLFDAGDAVLSGFTTTASSNTLTLDATSGPVATGNEWIFVGKKVDIGTTANPQSVATARTITAITGNTITIDGAAVAVTGGTHFLYTAGAAAGGTSREMTSLRQIVSATGTVGNLNPSTTPVWKASVDSTSTNLSIANLLSLRAGVVKANGTRPNLLVMGPDQHVKLYLFLQPQVRFQGEGNIGAGGVDNVTFEGMKIVEDPRCPNGFVFMLNKDRLFMVREEKPYWFGEVVGQQMIGPSPGEAAWNGTVGYHVNLATDMRSAHGAMTTLT